MVDLHRWTAWNLTRNGWHRSQALSDPSETAGHRPADTLLALVSAFRIDDPHRLASVHVLFRSPDTEALAEAMEQFGVKPKD
jgi:hypothetical protein